MKHVHHLSAFLITAALCLAPVMTGCDSAGVNEPDRGDDDRITIVCTTAMVADIARAVAGERADVTALMGEGVDPHLYQTTASDVRKIMNADVVFYNGLLLEGRMSDTFVKTARQGQRIYAVTEEIDEEFLLAPPEFAGHFDPHVWMDVRAWSACIDVVANVLAELDSVHAQEYLDNAASYKGELESLDAYVRKVIGSIPSEQRVLVTAHDAFNYFSRAYDIRVVGVQGISTESQAGVHDINRIVDELVNKRIQAVFVESSVNEKNVESLIEGAAARGHDVTIGGVLFSDAMGAPGTYEGTYIGMIDHNATTIARALGGEAPARGMNGELTGSE